jgi:hypothetical protein
VKEAPKGAIAVKMPALVEVSQQRDGILDREILTGGDRLFARVFSGAIEARLQRRRRAVGLGCGS